MFFFNLSEMNNRLCLSMTNKYAQFIVVKSIIKYLILKTHLSFFLR